MLGKLKGAILGNVDTAQSFLFPQEKRQQKYRYSRPYFLGLNTEDELQVCSDHSIRPILVPRDINKLYWNSGYAETINAGKSVRNEDQAAVFHSVIRIRFTTDEISRRVCDMLPEMFTRSIRQRSSFHRGPVHVNGLNPESSMESVVSTDEKQEENSKSKSESKEKKDDLLLPLLDAAADEIANVAESSAKISLEEQKDFISDPLLNPSGDFLQFNKPSQETETQVASNLNDGNQQSSSLPGSISLNGIEEQSTSFFPSVQKSQSLHGMSSGSDFIQTDDCEVIGKLPFYYFALFDGHAGSDVAVAASQQLHQLIKQKLLNIAELLIAFSVDDESTRGSLLNNVYKKQQLNSTPQGTSNSFLVNSSGNLYKTIEMIRDKKKRQEAKENGLYVPEKNDINKDSFSNVRKLEEILPYDIQPAADKQVTIDNLITGALESAFWDMDFLIANDKTQYQMFGGCTAIISLFILGKLYVANAGDSRAVLIKDKRPIPMSFDFTPESERERIKYLALMRPDLLGDDFTHLEFIRRPSSSDVGKSLLCREAYMSGWAYKTVTMNDLKFPLVYGEGKRSRVLATIGVTRGFGDHELRAQNSTVFIKPFLSPEPEVRIYDIENDDSINENDVLVMGTDGLWDVTSNDKVAEICTKAFQYFPMDEKQETKDDKSGDEEGNEKNSGLNHKYRYISAAQDLVMHARGKSKQNNGRNWKTTENRQATIDDISVFVIPLKGYKQIFADWKKSI